MNEKEIYDFRKKVLKSVTMSMARYNKRDFRDALKAITYSLTWLMQYNDDLSLCEKGDINFDDHSTIGICFDSLSVDFTQFFKVFNGYYENEIVTIAFDYNKKCYCFQRALGMDKDELLDQRYINDELDIVIYVIHEGKPIEIYIPVIDVAPYITAEIINEFTTVMNYVLYIIDGDDIHLENNDELLEQIEKNKQLILKEPEEDDDFILELCNDDDLENILNAEGGTAIYIDLTANSNFGNTSSTITDDAPIQSFFETLSSMLRDKYASDPYDDIEPVHDIHDEIALYKKDIYGKVTGYNKIEDSVNPFVKPEKSISDEGEHIVRSLVHHIGNRKRFLPPNLYKSVANILSNYLSLSELQRKYRVVSIDDVEDLVLGVVTSKSNKVSDATGFIIVRESWKMKMYTIDQSYCVRYISKFMGFTEKNNYPKIFLFNDVDSIMFNPNVKSQEYWKVSDSSYTLHSYEDDLLILLISALYELNAIHNNILSKNVIVLDEDVSISKIISSLEKIDMFEDDEHVDCTLTLLDTIIDKKRSKISEKSLTDSEYMISFPQIGEFRYFDKSFWSVKNDHKFTTNNPAHNFSMKGVNGEIIIPNCKYIMNDQFTKDLRKVIKYIKTTRRK